ncbi:MAG TPA: hypothetical protein VFR36_06365 [Sphingomicrobium sp.]|nr:hypothetical protein [Sphingomicrobium sp.]
MVLIAIGALLIIGGVVLAANSTLKRGQLSQAEQPISHEPRDTLEPMGRGRRLSLKADLPGLAVIAIGVILLFLGIS